MESSTSVVASAVKSSASAPVKPTVVVPSETTMACSTCVPVSDVARTCVSVEGIGWVFAIIRTTVSRFVVCGILRMAVTR